MIRRLVFHIGHIGLIAAVLVQALAGGLAAAYVRTTSQRSNLPVQWPVRCIVVQPDLRGSRDLSITDVDGALARSVANWTSRTQSCTFLQLASLPASHVADVAIDGLPMLVFRNSVWQRPGALMPHDPAAIGLTTVFYVDTPGVRGDATILDADIELNNVNYTFTIDPTVGRARDGTMLADLENTLTHELGHVQGLAHTCWDHLTDTPPLDDKGQPIPDCNGTVPASVLATTMYPYATMEGETSKRHLSQDDINGVCEVYPTTAPAPACYNEVDGGCALVPRGLVTASGVPAALFALVALALAERTRRRRRR